MLIVAVSDSFMA